ncbi:hypothetical protein PIB30_032119 [Stylosanthes scabra]|uniref:Uncharacterized protein n=1 Tax=Stylosanthes scabra TaxID=79078 RepID=A0ABU6UCH2_9FABA|nr:hypothetical protein [Stylosanthes scabra]
MWWRWSSHLSAAVTSTPELRLTHRLRLREVLSVLVDSIPGDELGAWMLDNATEIACER